MGVFDQSALHGYQKYSIEFIVNNPFCGLFLDMGLGKTATALTAIDKLMFDLFEVNKVLVIAPLRVASQTWPAEAAKWVHLKHLRLSKILGTKQHRLAALQSEADIYIINRENIKWLVEYYGPRFPFDMVV
ncbi:MAG: ATP-dependent helicase, partial [Clostridiales bacterium]|nr:ATP-dependent helicase [Clostridiales bacterium]